MNSISKFTIILLIPFIFTNTFAQKRKIDSLQKIINTSKNDTLKIKLTNSLAWKFFQNKEYLKAKQLVLENIETAKKENWQQGLAYSYETIGDFYYEQKEQDSAIYYATLASIAYEKAQDYSGASYINWVWGYRLMIQSKFPETKKLYIKSLDFAKRNNNRKYELQAMQSLGWLYHEMGNHSQSNQYFTQSLVIAKELKNNESIGTINSGFASNYIAINNFKAAQEKYFELAEFFKKENNLEMYASNLATAANLYRRLNQNSKIEAPLLEAYKIQKQIKDNWNLMTTSRYLGMLYTDQHKFDKAENYLFESLNLSKESKYNNNIIKAYYTIERYYYLKKDIKNGDKYQKLVIQTRDSLFTVESNKNLAEFDIKYKTAEKEAKLKEAQLEIAEKQNWIIVLSLGFLGILIIGGLLWRISSIKTKAAETEKLKNLEIENQKKLLSAKEIERQRIAKELHDSVGSQLTVVSTSLDNAFYLFENQKLMPEKLENISGEVRLAAQSLRDTIWATYNSEISVADLRSRIQEFIKKFADENAFKLELEISGDQTVLNPIEGLNLFRIVQESLNNIQKYAQASLVKIEGNFEKDNYNLKISDNGLGFDLSKANIGNSYGLSNMKSRAEEIGGILIIDSKKNIGTSVFFEKTVI
jgi:signal transduction histidine kinase